MTAKTFPSLTDDPEPNARSVVETAEYPRLSEEYQALRALIDQRRVGG